MQFHLILASLLLLSVRISNAANILAIFNVPSKSHHIFNMPLPIALAERGHNVTLISTMPLKKNITNLSYILIEGAYEFIQEFMEEEGMEPEKMSEDSPFTTLPLFAEWIENVGQFTLENVAIKKLLSYPEDFKFDLIILEPNCGESLYGIGKRFGSPPIAIVAGFSHPLWVNGMVGNPDNPSYIPDIMFPFNDHMTFYQRMQNTLMNIFAQYIWNYKVLPIVDAHPNVHLFITHSGLMSTLETIQRGVPVIGIPFLADQFVNIQKCKSHGMGERLQYKDITKESVLKTIRTVLDNPSYTKNTRELSAKFRDQPQTPRERAVFWCEYVMRHKGAPHLRSAALDLTWYQYFLLDVIAVLLAALLTPLVLIGYCCKRIFFKKQIKLKKH